jgi:hypothetical protein
MKHSFSSRFSLLLLAGSLLGCNKVAEPPVAPLAYSFQVLNAQGQATSVFAAGQNIVFRFQVENRSDQDMYLANPLFAGPHFLEVYQLGSGQSMGKPYQDLCLTYQAFYLLSPHSVRAFTVPWLKSAQYPEMEPFCTHAATTALPAGRYRLSFSPTLTWNLGAEAATTEPTPATATQEFEVN